jgi:hypothetical protein
LSEVRLYAIPNAARELSPADGTANVDPATAVLTWRAGREAGAHNLYLGTDEQAVIDGTAAMVTLPTTSTTPDLELGKTYYWRVDEVNNVEDPALWAGSVQSFTTADSIPVDDMESYKNQAGFFIYEAWVDGYQKSDNGSLVGVGADFEAEKTIVHGGSQSLPMAYGDLGITDSWATLAIETPKDWSKHGVKSLSLYFHGSSTNTAGQLYVKVNNTKFEYKGAATDITTNQWFPFTVDLAGVTTVNSLTIGVAGGSGLLLVDDIRLSPQASELITPAAPDAANLQAFYQFEGNFNDSSGKGNHGTALVDAVTFNDLTRGQVLDLDGLSGVSVPLISLSDEVTITAWVNVETLGANINSVFMNTNWEPNCVHTRIQSSAVNMGHNLLGNLGGSSNIVITEWNFVSYTVKNTETETTRAIYLNGVGEASATDAVDPEVGPRGVYVGNGTIGAWDNNGTLLRFLTGMVDDVRIYDRALSAGEIASLAGRTAPLYKAF